MQTWAYYLVKQILWKPLQASIHNGVISCSCNSNFSRPCKHILFILLVIDYRIKPGNTILQPLHILQLLRIKSLLLLYQVDNKTVALCLSHLISPPTCTSCTTTTFLAQLLPATNIIHPFINNLLSTSTPVLIVTINLYFWIVSQSQDTAICNIKTWFLSAKSRMESLIKVGIRG